MTKKMYRKSSQFQYFLCFVFYYDFLTPLETRHKSQQKGKLVKKVGELFSGNCHHKSMTRNIFLIRKRESFHFSQKFQLFNDAKFKY